MKHRIALLVTGDRAVEQAVRQVATKMGDEVKTFDNGGDALAAVVDASGQDEFAIVDLDVTPGCRAVLRSASGCIPVIAITKDAVAAKAWLDRMVRCHRVQATIEKPVRPERLREAIDRVESDKGQKRRRWPSVL